MARTKRAAAAIGAKSSEPKTNHSGKIKHVLLKKIDEEEKKAIEAIDKQVDQRLKQLHIDYIALKTDFPVAMLNRTLAEIKNGEINNSQLSVTTMTISDQKSTFNSTKGSANSTKSFKKNASRNIANSTVSSGSESSEFNKTKVPPRTRGKRSISAGCVDDGYSTAESSHGNSSGRRHNATRESRSRTRAIGSAATSRSLSRTATTNTNVFRTPANKQPPISSGTITPKYKPNTPLMYVRRPKVGEMAWSNQGSPLLVTGTVAPEQTANVNIPVGGNILSMLPTRGALRESQIPNVDEYTRRDLEILRDNLIKVCQTIKK